MGRGGKRTGSRVPVVVAAIGLLAAGLIFGIEDWRLDFVAREARIEEGSEYGLEPLVSARSARELAIGLRWAGSRIGNWEYVGRTSDGATTLVVFVRTHRLLRLADDIVLRIEDEGGRRVITGESRGRRAVGDLGRNRRNLRRLLGELRGVLDGAELHPVIGDGGTG